MFSLGNPAARSLLLLTTLVASADAQRRPLFVNPMDYQRLGLQTAWSTQVEIDSQRTEVAAVTLQIVGLNSYEQLQETAQQVFEVRFENGSLGARVTRIAENDLDARGRVIGRAEAKRLADKLMIQLEAEGGKPSLVVKSVPSMVIYAQSSSGLLQAIDAETGSTRWTSRLGTGVHPVLRPGANDDYVAAIRGSQLYILSRATGRPVWDRPLDQNPSFGATVSGKYVFVPGSRGMIEGYLLPDSEGSNRGATPWVYSSGARITAPPLVTNTTVSWATSTGQMFVASVDGRLGPEMLYRHQTSGPIYGNVAYLPPNQLIIGSSGGYVASIEQQDGLLSWRFSTGDEVRDTPMAHQDRIYVTTVRDELFCINAEDGVELWTTRGVHEVIAIGKTRVYARDELGRLLAIDQQTGDIIGSIPTDAYEMALHNHLTDRIYLLSHSGAMLCLKEVGSGDALLHHPLPQPPSDEDEPQQRRRSSPTDEMTPDDGLDAEVPGDMGDDEDMFGDDNGDFDADEAPMDDAEDAFDFGVPDDVGDDEPADDDPADDEDDLFDFG